MFKFIVIAARSFGKALTVSLDAYRKTEKVFSDMQDYHISNFYEYSNNLLYGMKAGNYYRKNPEQTYFWYCIWDYQLWKFGIKEWNSFHKISNRMKYKYLKETRK